MISAGQYRELVTIYQQPWVIESDDGLAASPLVEFAQAYCRVTATGGSEKWRNQQLQPETTHIVELREYVSGVTSKMVLSYQGRIFQIVGVRNEEMRHRWTTLECRELAI